MAKANAENRPGHITEGDVLADIGFSAEEIRETEIKMTIWRPLRAEIEARGWTQAQLAGLLQIHQPDASLLVRGRVSKFSVAKLMQFAERLGLTVSLMVKPKMRPARTLGKRSSASPARRRNASLPAVRTRVKAGA
jgi:predicted XRE-type DNA-binding protein